jgi:hypothetical protein
MSSLALATRTEEATVPTSEGVWRSRVKVLPKVRLPINLPDRPSLAASALSRWPSDESGSVRLLVVEIAHDLVLLGFAICLKRASNPLPSQLGVYASDENVGAGVVATISKELAITQILYLQRNPLGSSMSHPD